MVRHKIYFFLILFALADDQNIAYAQSKFNNVWVFGGDSGGIDFNTGVHFLYRRFLYMGS
jgi:hypothetical protein